MFKALYLHLISKHHFGLSLFPCPPSPVISLFEHIGSGTVQHPVTSFTSCVTIFNCVFVSWYFHETFIQGEVVSNGILPSLTVVSVVWESVEGMRFNFVFQLILEFVLLKFYIVEQ